MSYGSIRTLLFALICFFAVGAHANHLLVTDDDIIDLNSNCYAYRDDSKSMGLSEILKVPKTDWKLLGPNGPLLSYKGDYTWVKVNLENGTKAKRRYLLSAFNDVAGIRPYIVRGDRMDALPVMGTMYPYSQKVVPDRNYYFPVTLAANEKVTIYIDFENPNMPLRAPLFLVDDLAALDIAAFNNSVVWFWRGVFILALVISLTLYFFVRLKLFLQYFFLNIGVACFIGSEIGDFFLFGDVDSMDLIRTVKWIGTSLVYTFFPLFLNNMVNISKHGKTVWKAMFVMIHANWITVLLSLLPGIKDMGFMTYVDMYIMFSALTMFFIVLVLLLIAVFRREQGALLMFGLYAFYIGSLSFSVLLPNMGMTSMSPYTYNSLFAGSILEIIMFMFLMGRETYQVYKDKNALLTRQNHHQRQMTLAVVSSQEQERNRIGRELHDMIGGNLALVKHGVAGTGSELEGLVDHTISDVRNMSHGLVTPSIRGDEFKDEILQLANNSSSADGHFKVNVIFHNWPELKDETIITHLYRIAQELIQNAIKHSEASHVFLQFLGGQGLQLSYEDNGKGFDVEAQTTTGIGLNNIQNRVKAMQGQLSVESGSNFGTVIFVDVPV